MKRCKQIIYTLLALSLAIFATCSDGEVAVDYTDDNAYPPPVVNITSPTSLEEALFQQTQMVTGSIESSNGLRDIYITLLKGNADVGYEEISRNNRVFQILDSFPNELDFSLNISLSDASTTAIGVFATDIYTKTTIIPIVVEKLKGVPPRVTLNPSEIDQIELNESVTIEGTASSAEDLASITYALVRKTPYLELSTPGIIEVGSSETEKSFSFDITVDDERADAISVVVTDKEGFRTTAYTDIKSITGIPEGRALIFEDFEMAPEWEIMSNAGVIPTQPYLFSIEGIQVGNEIKNVVTLKEAVDAPSGSIDFAFVNIWRNSDRVPVGSRGFAYVSAARLSGGPVGRQVDTDWLGGMTKNAIGFRILSQEEATTLNLDNFFETTTGNWETFEALSALDSYVTPAMVNNDINRILRQRTNAGASGNCSLEITSGTYIAFRRVVNGSEDKLGIMKVIEAADDTDATSDDGCKITDPITGGTTPGASAHYTGPNLPGFVYEGVTKLYGRTTKLKIIVQQ
ncbi:hypothetical protein PSM36_1586 [Proteiniphilum saccharofermentans]|uniref:Secreted protein n=1 Tax=Proteiniphilum saccharofermentans TaxID=1642647 RepID=A0A1R3SVQ7_9BACT|nr:hypothetical protein [Proteiniphilum saccharofermentans]SCD20406.1 hypothetical protein PSM36_1586 [Proteiniphilum saccharofermentans]